MVIGEDSLPEIMLPHPLRYHNLPGLCRIIGFIRHGFFRKRDAQCFPGFLASRCQLVPLIIKIFPKFLIFLANVR